MVVSERFVWLHIPKTAGDATLLMFQELDHPWRLLDAHTDERKHGTLAEAYQRVPGCEGLPVIANLRRLPEMALSYFQHMRRHAPHARFASGRCFGEMEFRDYLHYVIENPRTQSYDWHLDHFVGAREVDHWLRVSELAESFLEVIGRYLPIPADAAQRIRVARANEGPYERKNALTDWYTRDAMEALYRNSPRWQACERREYGTLPFETLRWG